MKLWPFATAKKLGKWEGYGKAGIYTPDILKLEKQCRLTIFVADDMQKGGALHEYVAETSLSGKWPLHHGYTVDPFYHWKKDLGDVSYSVALEDQISGHVRWKDELARPARIMGELYSIRPRQIIKLDFLRENGLQFFRKEVDVYIPHSKVIYSKTNPLPALVDPKQQTFKAWMYVGNHYYWDDQLGGVLPSSPIPRLIHNREEIGTFTRFKI